MAKTTRSKTSSKPKAASRAQTTLFKTAVPKMSEGYYSGDKPNPNLRAFVEQHLKEKPYDPVNDEYNVPAFNKPIETTKATAIYNMHTYWSKKPYAAIREYVQHFTQPGDLVLDPFCGSGSTGIAALLEGRNSILIDRSPAATFITAGYVNPMDPDEIRGLWEEFQKTDEFRLALSAHKTLCPNCGSEANIESIIWSEVYRCPRHFGLVALYDCQKRLEVSEGESSCPICKEPIGTSNEIEDLKAVEIRLKCMGGCSASKSKFYHDEHASEFASILANQSQYSKDPSVWFPTLPIPKARVRLGRLRTTGIDRVDLLFPRRNLHCLSNLRHGLRLPKFSPLLFAFSASLLSVSYLIYAKGTTRQPNAFYVPPIRKEVNAINTMTGKINNLIAMLEEYQISAKASSKTIVSTETAMALKEIPTNSIDYVFTDPPYSNKIPYYDLNCVWEGWLQFKTDWKPEEILVEPEEGKDLMVWRDMLKSALKELYRVLKPGRWLSLCYHDTSTGTWELLQDTIAEVGFMVQEVSSALTIKTTGGMRPFEVKNFDISKRDIVINLRKPSSRELGQSEIVPIADLGTFRERTLDLIRRILLDRPGLPKDAIYDEIVSHLVTRGKFQVHDFDELLELIAEPIGAEPARWFLFEKEETKIDETEATKEDKAAKQLAGFVSTFLEKYPDREGVHFSDLFESYIYLTTDKAKRPLVEWLPDYFFKTEEGTWRLPANEDEEKLKAHVRASGANRRIKRFISFLQQGIPVPEKERPNDATLAEWIRQSKRSGLFEYGKLIYEKGGMNLDALPEALMVNVEEDYQTCVRMLARDK